MKSLDTSISVIFTDFGLEMISIDFPALKVKKFQLLVLSFYSMDEK